MNLIQKTLTLIALTLTLAPAARAQKGQEGAGMLCATAVEKLAEMQKDKGLRITLDRFANTMVVTNDDTGKTVIYSKEGSIEAGAMNCRTRDGGIERGLTAALRLLKPDFHSRVADMAVPARQAFREAVKNCAELYPDVANLASDSIKRPLESYESRQSIR